jgi:hypothetical protein
MVIVVVLVESVLAEAEVAELVEREATATAAVVVLAERGKLLILPLRVLR